MGLLLAMTCVDLWSMLAYRLCSAHGNMIASVGLLWRHGCAVATA